MGARSNHLSCNKHAGGNQKQGKQFNAVTDENNF